MNKVYNIGICSIGSGVGQSVLDSCRLSNLPINTIGLGTNNLAFGLYESDDYAIIPSYYSENYIDELIKICREKNIHLLIPGHDDETEKLSSNINRFSEINVQVIVSSIELIQICRSKELMQIAFPEVKELFVKSFTYEEALQKSKNKSLDFPIISKPKDGFASKAVNIIRNYSELEKSNNESIIQEVAIPHKQDPNYQTYIEKLKKGINTQLSEISIQLICDRNGEIRAKCTTYNKLSNGIPIEIIPYKNIAIDQAINKLIPYLIEKGLRGPINIQGRLTDDGFKIFELNPRFTGITGLRATMGFNEVEECIKHWIFKKPIDSIELNTSLFGIRQTTNKPLNLSRNKKVMQLAEAINRNTNNKKKPLILVTGSTGSIGQTLVKELLKINKFDIWTLDRDKKSACKTHNNSQVTCYDWEDFNAGTINFGCVNKLVHLASARPFHSDDSITDSLTKSMQLFTKFAMYASGEIIFSSSLSVYGNNPDLPWKESSIPKPMNYYAQAKYMLEQHLKSLKKLKPSLSYLILRIIAVTGKVDGIEENEALAKIIHIASNTYEIKIQDGTQVLGRIHIEDAVESIITTINDTSYKNEGVYNICMHQNLTLKQISEKLSILIEAKKKKKVTIKINTEERKKSYYGDNTKFKNRFSWETKVTIDDIIEKIL